MPVRKYGISLVPVTSYFLLPTSDSVPSTTSPNHRRGRTTAPLPKMDSSFLDPSVGGYVLEDPLNSSNSAHSGDASSHWPWLDEYGPFDLEQGSLQSNDLQPEGLQHIHHTSHDVVSHKALTNSLTFPASHQGDYLNFPHTSSERPNGLTSWIPYPPRLSAGNYAIQEPEHCLMYRSPPIYDNSQLTFETNPMSEFTNSFRGSNDFSASPMPYFGQFSTADLGTLPQPLNAEDTASQASCNSKCTSSVCDNENCSVTGIPCDDPACVDNITPAEVPDLTNQLPTQVASITDSFHQSHSQPCNHTESEHLVARTLGELRAPAELHTQEKAPLGFQLDTVVSRIGGQFPDGDYEPHVSSSPQLSTEIETSGPKDSQIPSLLLPPGEDEDSEPETHICQWTAHPHTNPHTGENEICGAEFTNTKDFHDHLCDFHVGKLTSHTGYACLWVGCPRKHDRPFVTRGKLRRHVATHSICK
ncbi:hypothetical protein FHL15_005267 [Xylaria flabelliformis]|uniref:C2H2-type domain-containing protein n=1 Tax=Xylaria flabelliformis TaxID=2512241 RepID=A0A553I122_9PEZI|nr:hypothetical protein FHL15_005267 [Xylaria flabelliformis]